MPEITTKSRTEGKTHTVEETNRRRSERVILRIPLLLAAIVPGGKRISIVVHTLIVNAHGGLLEVGIEMVRGQLIRLNNLRSEATATGRVLRVEGPEEGQFSVAFEFETPS